MAERFATARGGDAFTPQGATVPGSPQEAAAARAGLVTTEVFPLTLFAVGGMMLFPAAGDLLTMFVALEVLSLPLYILCGLARRRRLLSQEASLKYFLLGAFSSAFFLFGTALLFGYAGVAEPRRHRHGDHRRPAVAGPAAAGHRAGRHRAAVQGRRGAVPLLDPRRLPGRARRRSPASWPPAPRSRRSGRSCGWSTSASPAAAGTGSRCSGRVAIVTMVVGSVLAITQTDVKRMLAYSSIAHAGFILVGVLAFDKTGVSGVLFYLVAYGFSTDRRVRGRDAWCATAPARPRTCRSGPGWASSTRWWRASSRCSCWRSPGIPLTSGFTAKFAVFAPAVAHGAVWLAVVGVVASAIAAFFYVRVIVLMYFSEPTGDAHHRRHAERIDDHGGADHRRGR